MTAGELFRTTRQQRNLSVDDVSQRTKIRARIIEAMERDEFGTLPAAYMGSFVKTYARFLNIHELPAIPELQGKIATSIGNDASVPTRHHSSREYSEHSQVPAQVRVSSPAHGQALYNQLPGVALPSSAIESPAHSAEHTTMQSPLLNGINPQRSPLSDGWIDELDAAILSEFPLTSDTPTSLNAPTIPKGVYTSSRPKDMSWLKYVYAAVAVLIGVAGYIVWNRSAMLPEQSNRLSMPVSTTPLTITGDANTDNALLVGGVPRADSLSRGIIEQDSLVLEARAIESAWINVVIDRKRSEQLTLEAGKTYRWSAEKLITLQLGNAGAVQFRRNGVPLEPFGKLGAVVRNVTITREMLNSSSSPVVAQRLATAESSSFFNASSPSGSSSSPVSTSAVNGLSAPAASSVAETKASGNASGNNNAVNAPSASAVSTRRTADSARRLIPRPIIRKPQAKLIEPAARPVAMPELKPVEKPKVTQQTPASEKRN